MLLGDAIVDHFLGPPSCAPGVTTTPAAFVPSSAARRRLPCAQPSGEAVSVQLLCSCVSIALCRARCGFSKVAIRWLHAPFRVHELSSRCWPFREVNARSLP